MTYTTIRYHIELEYITSFYNKEKPNLINLILSYLTPYTPLSILYPNNTSEND